MLSGKYHTPCNESTEEKTTRLGGLYEWVNLEDTLPYPFTIDAKASAMRTEGGSTPIF